MDGLTEIDARTVPSCRRERSVPRCRLLSCGGIVPVLPFTSPFRNYFTVTYLRVLRFGVQVMVGASPSRTSLMVAAMPASRLFSLTVSAW